MTPDQSEDNVCIWDGEKTNLLVFWDPPVNVKQTYVYDDKNTTMCMVLPKNLPGKARNEHNTRNTNNEQHRTTVQHNTTNDNNNGQYNHQKKKLHSSIVSCSSLLPVYVAHRRTPSTARVASGVVCPKSVFFRKGHR